MQNERIFSRMETNRNLPREDSSLECSVKFTWHQLMTKSESDIEDFVQFLIVFLKRRTINQKHKLTSTNSLDSILIKMKIKFTFLHASPVSSF